MNKTDRLHALDAVRAFALIAGVILHAAMSYLPGFAATGWPIADNSPSGTLGVLFYVIHMFRMTTFFLIAGFFGRMLLEREGVRGFIANRSKRILVPLVVGWIVVFPAIVAALAWGAAKANGGVLPAPPKLPAGALSFPLTHLWFLWVLILVYTLTLGVHWMARKLDRRGTVTARLDGVLPLAMGSPVATALLGLPLAVALYFTPGWMIWMGIPTPDQSLIPNTAAAVGFLSAFALGWFVQHLPAILRVWERQWWMHLAIALVLTVVTLRLAGMTPALTPAPAGWQTFAHALLYAAGIWNWTFAVIGIALRFFSAASASRRYVADASYWIYLVHLPVVFLLQAAMMNLPWHWSVKFPLLVATALALLFASYHLLVRYTYVGEVLNGRRYRRAAAPVNPPAEPVTPDPSAMGESIARLSGACKRFGKTVALDGLDLDVRQGELLAVLGPNGAGKSTAISLLLGLQQPDSGSATLFSQSPEAVAARYHVGVMMQEVAFAPELRVRELIDSAASYYPAPLSADEAMALTHVTDLAKRPYAKLSGGQKRQAQFAMAVVGQPALLFLDEPTAGLDIQAREMLWATLRMLVARGVSIVLTTHYLEEAEALADRVVVLAKGRTIASGSVDEIRALVVRKRVSCSSSLTPEQVQVWPGVAGVSRDRQRLNIIATDAEAVVRRLMVEDAHVSDLEVLRAGLAEAFTELTQEAA